MEPDIIQKNSDFGKKIKKVKNGTQFSPNCDFTPQRNSNKKREDCLTAVKELNKTKRKSVSRNRVIERSPSQSAIKKRALRNSSGGGVVTTTKLANHIRALL